MSASHLKKPFNPIQLRKIAGEMEFCRRGLNADIVVVRGLSGIIVASAMSALFETPFAVVRKPEETTHGHRLEVVDEMEDGGGYCGPRTYGDWVIVDDLISSGTTVRSIIDGVQRKDETITGRCVAILLYNADRPDTDSWYYDSQGSIPVIMIGAV